MKKITYLKLIALIGLLLGLNFLATTTPFQLDFTEDHLYSLSPVSKKIVRHLNDVVTVKFFLSQKLPPQFLAPRQRLLAFLDRYQQLSPKIQIKILDPTNNPQARRTANHLGLTPLQFSTINQNQLQVTQGYFALSVGYHNHEELLPLGQLLSNPEYSLTAAIFKLSQKKEKIIGWVSDGQTGSPSNFSLAWKALKQIATPQLINLDNAPQDLSTLLIINPQANFSQQALQNLDNFLKEQHGILVLFDKYHINGNLRPSLNSTNFSGWLKKHGFGFGEKKFVSDRHAALANFQNPQGQSLLTPYPPWPVIDRGNINHSYAPLAGIGKVTLFWTTPIKLASDVTWIVRTTPQSWLISPDDILPTNLSAPTAFRQVALGGYQKKTGRLAVISDSDFIRNQNIYHHPENLVFFLDLVDLVNGNPELAKIRNKLILSRPLSLLAPTQYLLLEIIVLGLPSILIVLAGLGYWFHRRHAQKN